MDNLKKPLKNLGFTDKEVEIYAALLEMGSASYTELAKRTGIKRTTLYAIVQRMQDRGVVRYLVAGRQLSPAKPEELFTHLQHSTLQLHRLIPQLNELTGKRRSISRVKLYRGAASIKQAYAEVEGKLPAKDSRTIRVVSDIQTWNQFWQQHDQLFPDHYLKQIKQRGYRTKVFISGEKEPPFDRQYIPEFGMHVKHLPLAYKHEFDMEIGPSYLIIADLKSAQPYAIKIISTELAQAMSTFFDFAWDLYP